MEEKLGNQVRNLLHKRIGNTEPPLNVAVIGASGSGKSSFINSVLASFSGEYREHLAISSDEKRQVRHRKWGLSKEQYLESADRQYLKYSYPVFYEIPNFENKADKISTSLLKVIFDGQILDSEKLRLAEEEYRQNGIYGLQRKYSRYGTSTQTIDRIIFVASAKPNYLYDCKPFSFYMPSLPEHFIKTVTSAARQGNRDIPVCGVLTHRDRVDFTSEKYKKFEKEFRKLLDIPKTRFLLCTNYCDDYDDRKEKSRRIKTYPELDIPIIEFMTTVLDRVLDVRKSNQEKDRGHHKSTQTISSNQIYRRHIIYLLLSVFVAITFFWILRLTSCENFSSDIRTRCNM